MIIFFVVIFLHRKNFTAPPPQFATDFLHLPLNLQLAQCTSPLFAAPMEHHVVPAAPSSKHRHHYDNSVIAAATMDARQLGHVAAAKKHGIPAETVRTWLAYWTKHKEPFQVQRRGRKPFLTEEEKVNVNDAIDKLRAAPHCESVSASQVAAVARGIVGRKRPASLTSNGGPFKLTRQWANKFLHREGFSIKHRTSTRTVTDSELHEAKEIFFQVLSTRCAWLAWRTTVSVIIKFQNPQNRDNFFRCNIFRW